MGKKRLTTEEFIEKSTLVHGNKYDYSKVEYVNNHTEVCIICPEHGEFWEKPNYHMCGHGCKKCAIETSKKKAVRFKSNDEFISEVKRIYGDKYDLSETEYININTLSKFKCPKHGDFWRTPYEILKKGSCPWCGGTGRLTTEMFIKRSSIIHNNKYDYSKVDYKRNNVKVCIICPKHGEFWQKPMGHLLGQGCPKCKSSLGEMKVREILLNRNVKFEEQKLFDECRNKRPLPFDFYLPDYNVCIEYQGEQHFHPKRYLGKGEAFEKRIYLDSIKRDFCNNPKNPDLLEIRYDENIEEVLNSFFNSSKP